jgi:hypothetical protein
MISSFLLAPSRICGFLADQQICGFDRTRPRIRIICGIHLRHPCFGCETAVQCRPCSVPPHERTRGGASPTRDKTLPRQHSDVQNRLVSVPEIVGFVKLSAKLPHIVWPIHRICWLC